MSGHFHWFRRSRKESGRLGRRNEERNQQLQFTHSARGRSLNKNGWEERAATGVLLSSDLSVRTV